MPAVLRAKCVVVGDAGVGKSSICQVFHSDGSHFPKNYVMNCNVELLVKPVNIPDCYDWVEIYLYDSPGKDIFSDSVRQFWESPSMVMVVYDVTNDTTFSSCMKWLTRVRAISPDIQLPGVLVANKVDMDQRRMVTTQQGKELADTNGLEYFECSAKEMQNVDTAFYYLANEFYKLYQEKQELCNSVG